MGFIYFASNRSIPGMLKIGCTEQDVTKRLDRLFSTGVPEPFMIMASFRVTDHVACEREIHSMLRGWRANDRREFFHVGLKDALTQSVPVIAKFAPEHAIEFDSLNRPCPLDDETQSIIVAELSNQDRGAGRSAEWLAKHIGGDKMVMEYRLTVLQDAGLVEDRTSSFGPLWRVTSKGVRALVESGVYPVDDLDENDRAFLASQGLL